jgi:nucleotide-binding universal stress UspA family protein
MANKPLFETILCPVDFSEHSREALGYAALLTARNRGRLVVIFVEDPLLVAAARARLDEKIVIEDDRKQLRRFVERTISRYGVPWRSVTLDVAVGRPHEEIAWTAERLHCDLVVMGAHGRTGANKLLFGSTTHRMLRRSTLPILATPPAGSRAAGPRTGWPGKWALAPVDLGTRSRADALAASVAARELGARVELVHVVEPVAQLPWVEVDAERRNNQRLRRAMVWLTRFRDELAWAAAGCRVEQGAPAAEIARIAAEARTGLVIMTRRRGQGLFGPRQGAISYHVLCEARTPILALPSGAKWMRRVVSRVPKTEAA